RLARRGRARAEGGDAGGDQGAWRAATAGVVRAALGDRAATARGRAVPPVRLRPRGPASLRRTRVTLRPIPRGEVAPPLLACDFARLAEQVELVMDAGAKVLHFDAMDGKFVPPITIGPLVAASIAELIHDRGGLLDCHLMVDRPEHQIEAFAQAGADVITVH